MKTPHQTHIDAKQEAEPDADQKVVSEEETKEKPNEYEFSQKLITGSHLIQGAKPLDFKVDEKICKQICIYAQEFAQYFEFMRVDFYHHRKDIYFSECTFKPGALKKIKWMQVGKFLSEFWTKKPEL